jgi:hypothetical protein
LRLLATFAESAEIFAQSTLSPPVFGFDTLLRAPSALKKLEGLGYTTA